MEWGVHLPGTFRGRRDFVLSEDLVQRALREICKKRLWKRASLSLGASLGNLEVGSFTGDSERQMKEGSGSGASVPVEVLREEPSGKSPLQGTLNDT